MRLGQSRISAPRRCIPGGRVVLPVAPFRVQVPMAFQGAYDLRLLKILNRRK